MSAPSTGRPPRAPSTPEVGTADEPASEDRSERAEVAEALSLAAERAGEIVFATREILEALEVGRPPAGDRDPASAKHLEMLAEFTRQLEGEAVELSSRLGAVRRQIDEADGRSDPPPTVGDGPPHRAAPSAPGLVEPPSKGVMVLVSQMAAFGSSRVEIEERLREDLGISNARAVIAHVLDSEDQPGASAR